MGLMMRVTRILRGAAIYWFASLICAIILYPSSFDIMFFVYYPLSFRSFLSFMFYLIPVLSLPVSLLVPWTMYPASTLLNPLLFHDNEDTNDGYDDDLYSLFFSLF